MAQINNLNIFTFIKDIYQSLKHIDQCFSTFNESVNTRLIKLEDNQQILIDKLTNIESILHNISNMNKPNSGLDKTISNFSSIYYLILSPCYNDLFKLIFILVLYLLSIYI